MAVNVIKYYPLPNTTPTGQSNNQNNFAASASKPLNMTQQDYRIDQVDHSHQRFFVRYSTRLNDDMATTFFPEDIKIAEGRINQEDHVHGAVVDYTNTLSPSMILNARVGLARTLFVYNNQGLGFAPSASACRHTSTRRWIFLISRLHRQRLPRPGRRRPRRNGFMTYTARGRHDAGPWASTPSRSERISG